MGIPFHLRERSMEGALLSCWLYCVDIGYVFLFQFLLVCASGRAELFCLPLSYVVVVSRRRSPAGWFVSSFALGVTQDVVFIK